MVDLEGLKKDISEFNEKYKITEQSSYAEKLRHKLMSRYSTHQEILDLEKEVEDFFQSDASEEDKKMIQGYTESLAMLCNAIREGLL